MMQKVSRQEWRWVAVASIIALIVFNLPYLLGLILQTPDLQFDGFMFAGHDSHAYIAKMRWGASGAWKFRLLYTLEPHEGVHMVQVFFLLLGKLTALFTGQGEKTPAGTFIITWHAVRILSSVFLLIVLYRFVAEYLEEVNQRRLAWGLACFSGGLGWILMLAGLSGRADQYPVDFYIPEAFGYLFLFALSHLSLARGLEFLGWLLFFRSMEEENYRTAALAGILWFVMGILAPFFAAILGVMIAVWLTGSLILFRKTWLKTLRHAAVAGFPPGLVALYNVWGLVFGANPAIAQWTKQNVLPSPHPIHYLLGFGLLLVFWGIGFYHQRRSITPATLLLLIWPPISLGLAYAPIGLQRRLLEGILVILAIGAVKGLWEIFSVERVRRLVVLGMSIALFAGPLIFLLGTGFNALSTAWPVYHTADEIAAMNWLREEPDSYSHVLSTFDSGNVLSAFAPVFLYIGHGPETLFSEEKRITSKRFYTAESEGGMTDEERIALLEEFRIDFIWLGPQEQALCADNPCFDLGAIGVEEVFSQGEYHIYEVSSDG